MPHTIDTVKAVLTQLTAIRVATVFGSISSGRATMESDLDIAVATGSPLPLDNRMTLIEQLAEATGRSVDLLDLTTANGPVLQQALARGQLVKCIDRALYARLILKMLYNQADDMRYRRRILEERQRRWTQA